jgi:hypothetical protein
MTLATAVLELKHSMKAECGSTQSPIHINCTFGERTLYHLEMDGIWFGNQIHFPFLAAQFDPDDDTSFNVAVTLPSDPKNTYGVEINAHICGELILSIPGDGIFGCTMDGRFTKHLGGAGSPSPILGTEQMIYHYQKFEVSETPHLYRYNTCPTMHHIDTDFNWPGDEGKVVTYRVEVGSREIWNSITTSDNAFTWRSNYRNGFVGGAYTSLQSSYISARVIITSPGYTP